MAAGRAAVDARAVPRLKPWRVLVAYLPATIWAAYLLLLGSRSIDVPLPDLPLPTDKIGHFVLYGGLGFFTVLGWRWAGRRPAAWIPLVLAMSVGVADELHQRVVPARSADIFDGLVDVIAISFAFAMFRRTPTPNGKR